MQETGKIHRHCCGHEHTHDDGNAHHHEEEVVEGITVTHHEGASVLSVSREIHAPYETVKQNMQKYMDQLAGWIEECGGIIGHIKASLTSKKKSAMLSTTGDGCSIKEYDVDFTMADITIIVFGIDEYELCREVGRGTLFC